MNISEVFVSVQGEGVDVGKPAVFIRTAGCPLRCLYCDTKYAWSEGRKQNVEDLRRKVERFQIPYVVVTGGEPLAQENLDLLVSKLSSCSFIKLIDVESSGCIFRDDFLYPKVKLTLSPKPPSMNVEFPEDNVINFLSLNKEICLKFPVFDRRDYEFFRRFLYDNRELINVEVVFQPLSIPDEDYRLTVKRVIGFLISDKDILSDFNVRVIPQLHKLIGIK